MTLETINKYNYNYNYKTIVKYSIVAILILIIIYNLYLHREGFELKTEYKGEKYKNKTIYFISNSDFYKYVREYIESLNQYFNINILLYDKASDLPPLNTDDIYIFMKEMEDEQIKQITPDTDNVYLFNTEQMSATYHKDRINSYPKNIKMLDYSKANLMYYDGYYIKFLPYQVNKKEILNLPKIKDVCMMQGMSGRRQHVIDQLKEKNIIVDLPGGWDSKRDIDLFSHKIIININADKDLNIFESLRCDRCIFNRMIVISENKMNMEYYHLKDYMIFVDYDKVAEKVIEVLNNYNKFYKELGLADMDLDKLHIEKPSL